MKIKITAKDLESIQYMAREAYKNKSVQRLNNDNFLAHCYLEATLSWLKQKDIIHVELEDQQTSFESLNDD